MPPSHNNRRDEPEQSPHDASAIAARLLRSPPLQQVVMLKEIASHPEVTGCTLTCIELIGSPDPEVRSWATEALETCIRPDVGELRRLTTRIIASSNGEVCYWVATMLGRMESSAASAVDALAICARDNRYLPARERSVWALQRIGAASQAVVPILQDVASDSPPRLSRMASHAIAAIRRHAA